MTNSALASMLHNLHRLAESGDDPRQSDRQLLERFLSDRDEAAFARLVRRHGRMVLSACRRVLRDEADAEDAFQATFLVLLRRASSMRWRPSIGSWLFGVAHRIAVRARADAHRRRQREADSNHRPEIVPPPDLSWREGVDLLHEELDRLPDRYRLPLLLCYLDGKTRDEAARILGCSLGSLRGRLERGRDKLRRRLIGRGLALSGALLAALVEAPAASAVSPHLVRATLRAAVTGRYPNSVAMLIRAAAPVFLSGKMRLVAGLVLAAGLLAVSGPSFAPPAEQRKQAPPRHAAEDAMTHTVRGRVLDPDGKPVPGARLYAPDVRKEPPTWRADSILVERGMTDKDGRFQVALPIPKGRPDWRSTRLIAAADGYGVDWIELTDDKPDAEWILRLVKDQPVEGHVLSTEGKPLAGARVRVLSIQTAKTESIDGFLAAWQRDWRSAAVQTPKRVYRPLDQAVHPAITDKDGRFRLTGIGRERVAWLQVRGAGIATDTLTVIVRPGFDLARLKAGMMAGLAWEQPDPLFGPTIEYVAAADRAVEGTVREADSGKPVAGFVISAALGDKTEEAVSDARGRYRLTGVPRLKSYSLSARPPDGSAWLETEVYVQDVESLLTLKVDFTAIRGAIATGRLRDRTTGKGVAGAVTFAPLPGNPFDGKPAQGTSYRSGRMNATDAEGHFRIAVLPGPVALLARTGPVEKTSGGGRLNPYKQAEIESADRKRIAVTRDGGGHRFFGTAGGGLEELDEYNAVKYLDAAPDAAITCDLFVDRGKTLTVKIEDERGKPLTGTTVAGLTDSFPPNVFVIPEAQVTVYALDPYRPGWLPFVHPRRRLVFYHAERRLAGTLEVSGNEKEAPVARLAPVGSATGRVLDRDGQPIAGANVEVFYADRITRELYDLLKLRQPPTRTDKDGRFRLEGVMPHLPFVPHLSRGRDFLVNERRIQRSEVKPGQTLDLGDIRTKPSR